MAPPTARISTLRGGAEAAHDEREQKDDETP
jgi:hypothetical protein